MHNKPLKALAPLAGTLAEKMNMEDTQKYLGHLDGSGSDKEYEAVSNLTVLGLEFRKLLKEKYNASSKWG